MKKTKDHLNIDLEFLDKKESPKTPPKDPSKGFEFDLGDLFGNFSKWTHNTKQSSNTSSSWPTGYKYKWVVILVVWYTFFFFLNQWNSTNNSTSKQNQTQASQNNSEDSVINGQYRCTSYNSNQADLLNPDESEEQITFAKNLLEQRGNELDLLKNEIDSSSVNEYSSQYEVDDYNEKVDNYNAKLASYKREAGNLSSRIDRYNQQIQTHNNYLIQHCTKAY